MTKQLPASYVRRKFMHVTVPDIVVQSETLSLGGSDLVINVISPVSWEEITLITRSDPLR